MHVLEILLATVAAVAGVGVLIGVVWGSLHMTQLRDVPPCRWGTPRVSLIVPARDEERHIERAVRSLLAQSYPNYEIILIDDRSTDRTAEIVGRVARESGRVHVVRIDELPRGWLGKNHAMHVGAQRASGDYLLFADADVVMAPDALSRAVRLAELESADHLTVLPELHYASWALALCVTYGFMWGYVGLRPWKVRDPRSSASIGIGAFNLVRAEVYRAVDGHSRIKLRPDDDLMLGKLLKSSGYRQRFAGGLDQISLEWYSSFGELARGLRKNSFAVLQYNAALAGALVLAQLAVQVWPFLAVWYCSGWIETAYVVATVGQIAAYTIYASRNRGPVLLGVLYPFAALATVWVTAAAIFRTLRRRGIEWRGTFYSLDELRANRI